MTTLSNDKLSHVKLEMINSCKICILGPGLIKKVEDNCLRYLTSQRNHQLCVFPCVGANENYVKGLQIHQYHQFQLVLKEDIKEEIDLGHRELGVQVEVHGVSQSLLEEEVGGHQYH